MKLWIFSDLHLEVAPLTEPLQIPNADVCVVAGDILDNGILPSIDWLAKSIGVHMPVVFVAGNHEFYKSFMIESLDAASRIGTGCGVHFLENSCITIQDVVFCGATLWTDFDLFGQKWRRSAMRRAENVMPDYDRIRLQERPYSELEPIHTYRKHVESRQFLEQALDDRRGKKTVVVTHHAPSMRSVEKKYGGDILTTAFASDLDEFIETKEPALWVHGHLHHQVDYNLVKTRVVCNPRGYPGEVSCKTFNPALIVEV